MLFLLYERLNTEGHESFIGFCMHIRYFSPIVFQNNALTFVSQWTKEGSLLGATAFAAVPTRGGHLIPYGPPTVSCKHG